MNTALKTFGCVLLLCSAFSVGLAQQTAPPSAPTTPASPLPAAKSSAQSEAGEPRANNTPSSDGSAPAPVPMSPAAAAPAGPAAVRTPARTAAPRPGLAAAAAGAAATAQKGSTAADRLNLNTATVTGDREQPKVMYVVPWKSASIGDLSGKPMNSLLDEALAPVDREEFKREVAYYDAVRADTPQNGASAATKQGEK